MRYNHMFTLAFELESNHPTGEDVTPEQFRAALLARIRDLDRCNEWTEALGPPDDTCEMEPAKPAQASDYVADQHHADAHAPDYDTTEADAHGRAVCAAALACDARLAMHLGVIDDEPYGGMIGVYERLARYAAQMHTANLSQDEPDIYGMSDRVGEYLQTLDTLPDQIPADVLLPKDNDND